MRGWRLARLILACSCLLPPACALEPELGPRPAANPASNNEVEGLSFTLSVAPDTYHNHLNRTTALTLTIWNATKEHRRIPQLPVFQGSKRHPNNDLISAKGLNYVLRFKNGTAVVVDHVYPTGAPADDTMMPENTRTSPLELAAGGRQACKMDVSVYLFDSSRDAREAFKRCPSFAVTVVAADLKLRSNATFLNGEFDLPPGYDPIAELRAYRQREKARIDAERAREEAEVNRAVGFPPP